MGPAPFSFDFRPAQNSRVASHVCGLLPIEDGNLTAYFGCEHQMDFVSLRQSMVCLTPRGISDFLRAFEEAGGALRAEWTVLEATESAPCNPPESACAKLVDDNLQVRQNANGQLCVMQRQLAHVQGIIAQEAAQLGGYA
ncbi:hypothetical protein, unlikely [Trypanosoma congolense IL3000]|uniref:Uncharacterized protein n=1 Tax=Trypanosoma congolense (strain IL3000) TaxID=1068625 RepID=F9WBT5_TRYCI|nr:hypothetical protein, unlikely [Trypanosoma congolense IL3000]